MEIIHVVEMATRKIVVWFRSPTMSEEAWSTRGLDTNRDTFFISTAFSSAANVV
jgi:hypothetical protein